MENISPHYVQTTIGQSPILFNNIIIILTKFCLSLFLHPVPGSFSISSDIWDNLQLGVTSILIFHSAFVYNLFKRFLIYIKYHSAVTLYPMLDQLWVSSMTINCKNHKIVSPIPKPQIWSRRRLGQWWVMPGLWGACLSYLKSWRLSIRVTK